MQRPSYDQPAMRLGRAVDLYIGELARRGKAKRTRDGYERLLLDLARQLDPLSERTVDSITTDECRRFLDRWRDASPSTLASGVSLLRGFFAFHEAEGNVQLTPMVNIERPRKHRPEDLPVVTVSSSDVEKVILGCKDFQELLCVCGAGYLGKRRAALARARRYDADLEAGLIRFTDKGGKVSEQPIPDEFLAILREAEQHGVWQGPSDYLIPNRRRSTTNQKQRSDKVIYETVQKVAERVGIRVHVHALRAAFAVNFLESNPGRLESLKELMGHTRMETTMVYLRRMDRAKAMEDVRGLSWSGLNREQERRIRDSNPCSRSEPEESPDGAILNPLAAKLLELRVSERAVLDE